MHAVIHQKTSFQESTVSFPAPIFLLSVSGISSHQLFLAVYKPLTVYLFWVLNCAKEELFLLFLFFVFLPGFIQSPRESLRSCLKETFLILLFFFYIVKQKHQAKDESCKFLFWSWSVSHQPGMVWYSHLSLLSPSVVLHQP